ncbi:helix-turn-helix domain-containing protein [Thauera linaloolentis]|uniref:XRE family transcriptional regulator n=1 Tax=Thauera linaloolentis (strain DSM 12138 / JCM 21573 / CCUG 41526 / CIP 105981 / IAM 15112 / NBRC 102519 / 47Lol) TaxID=1123367 RepID=N6Z2J1_THAL4|nr:helix-turn-helix transcriptional regulator [Thauera linaloolentis]ENO86349.1 XRE family transcriptional regulator [Thauera linaloolentis 47Lol = DSM 12138]MCM8565051.1 helix-turn-helix domain-containing protein [Thauera linaloolentis]
MRLKPPISCFGRRMREARLLAGIPQDKLGVAIGLDEGTASARISRYETGVHAPPYDVANKLAHILRVPVAYFYCEDDELAGVIAAWGRASAIQRRNVRVFVEREIRGEDA